jgi:hypothetical protein
MDFAKIMFKGFFGPARKHLFPNSSGFAKFGKETDAHSLRGTGRTALRDYGMQDSLRNYISGHADESIGVDAYETPAGQEQLLGAIKAFSLRNDFDGPSLRQLARRSKSANQARRLLALAEIYDIGSRASAARIGGVGLQIVRDWVLRFNARGPCGQGRAIDAVRVDTQRFTIEAAALEAEADIMRAWIDAHLALGGGWRDAVNLPPVR